MSLTSSSSLALEASSPVSSSCRCESSDSETSSNDIEDIHGVLEQPVESLLSKLKPPPASELGRKRTIKNNLPPIGKHRSRGSSAGQLKKIQPHTRVKEFPEEPFKENYKKFFCMACREELCLKLILEVM